MCARPLARRQNDEPRELCSDEPGLVATLTFDGDDVGMVGDAIEERGGAGGVWEVGHSRKERLVIGGEDDALSRTSD